MQIFPLLMSFSMGMMTVIILELRGLADLLDPLRELLAPLAGG